VFLLCDLILCALFFVNTYIRILITVLIHAAINFAGDYINTMKTNVF